VQRGVVGLAVADDGVGDRQHLVGHGDQRDLRVLAFRNQASVELAQRRDANPISRLLRSVRVVARPPPGSPKIVEQL
jgi:hypothetical protein